MAAVTNFIRGHSPGISRTVDKVFGGGQYSGEILLSCRNLKEFPINSESGDISDTTVIDISKNRFSELPLNVCSCISLERLDCKQNVIKSIPKEISYLKDLVYLNLSRNQLTTLPEALCELRNLEVLLVNHNKLVSLPEQINLLCRLMEMDASCNELSRLPHQLGDLVSLESLSLRRNQLIEIPAEIKKLRLKKLDLSCNRLRQLPLDIADMSSLKELLLDSNPLEIPPAAVCTRGLVHIFKHLNKLRHRQSTTIMGYKRSHFGRHGSLDEVTAMHNSWHLADSGYSTTTESNSRPPWHQSNESNLDLFARLFRAGGRRITSFSNSNGASDVDENLGSSNSMTQPPSQNRLAHSISVDNQTDIAPKLSHSMSVGSALSAQRQLNEWANTLQPVRDGQEVMSDWADYSSAQSRSVHSSLHFTSTAAESGDEFTRLLQKQKSEREAKKRAVQQMKMEMENGSKIEQTLKPNSCQPTESMHSAHVLPVLGNQEQATSIQTNYQLPSMIHPIYQPTVSSVLPQGQLQQTVPSSIQPDGQHSSHSQHNIIKVVHQHQAANESKQNEGEQQLYGIKTNGSSSMQQEGNEGEWDDELRQRERTRQAAIRVQEEQRSRMNKLRDNRKRVDGFMAPGASLAVVNNSARSSPARSTDGPVPKHRQESNGDLAFQDPVYMTINRIDSRRSSTSSGSTAFDTNSQFSSSSANGHSDVPASGYNQLMENKSQIRYVDSNTVKHMRHSTCGQLSEPSSITQIPVIHEVTQSANKDAELLIDRLNEKDKMRQIQENALSAYFSKRSHSTSVGKELGSFSSRVNGINYSQLSQYGYGSQRNGLSERERFNNENLRRVIESQLRVSIADNNLLASLQDGVLLCHFANSLQPRIINEVYVPSPDLPQLSIIKSKKNVENFLEACQQLGVKQEHLFPSSALIDGGNSSSVLHQVSITVHALLSQCRRVVGYS